MKGYCKSLRTTRFEPELLLQRVSMSSHGSAGPVAALALAGAERQVECLNRFFRAHRLRGDFHQSNVLATTDASNCPNGEAREQHYFTPISFASCVTIHATAQFVYTSQLVDPGRQLLGWPFIELSGLHSSVDLVFLLVASAKHLQMPSEMTRIFVAAYAPENSVILCFSMNAETPRTKSSVAAQTRNPPSSSESCCSKLCP